MGRRRCAFFGAIGFAALVGSFFYFATAERTLVSDARTVSTPLWRGGGGAHQWGFTIAERRYTTATRLRFWSVSRFHKMNSEYFLTAATFNRVQSRWLSGNRAVYLQGSYSFQGGSYSIPKGPFEMVFDYEHDHLWTTLEDIEGNVSGQQFHEILSTLNSPRNESDASRSK